jgi:hypothetical protein
VLSRPAFCKLSLKIHKKNGAKMNLTKYRVKLILLSELLGTVGKDKEVYSSYIAGKKADLTPNELNEELESLPDLENSGWTGFHTLPDGCPIIYDYVIKGFFKDACGMLRRDTSSLSAREKAYKKLIDGLIFVEPRQIRLNFNGGQLGQLERPLRAETAQGPRVALARSDTAPIGTELEFVVSTIGKISQELIEEWLDYGQLRGLGQWRNGGWGRFSYEIEMVL